MKILFSKAYYIDVISSKTTFGIFLYRLYQGSIIVTLLFNNINMNWIELAVNYFCANIHKKTHYLLFVSERQRYDNFNLFQSTEPQAF